MGLRGPGAKPVRRKVRGRPLKTGASSNYSDPMHADGAGEGGEPVRAWQAKGLARWQRVVVFIEGLKITSGIFAGQNFRLRPWQKKIIRRIYRTAGRPAMRLVRLALLTIARKNGKTELAAALALCHLAGPEAEPRGEVYSAATDRAQASRIFRELEAFIFADADLSARCNIQRFAKRIEVLAGPGSGSEYVALSSDATKAHGLSPSFVVADELAQWRGRELFDNLRTGVGARAEPLIVVISTKSADPLSVMSEQVDYGRQVMAGVIDDPTTFAAIFEVPLPETPEEAARQLVDEKLWKLANPALGDFRSLEEMRDAAAKARRIPAQENAFRNLYLNQAVEADDRPLPAVEWQACGAAVDPATLAGRPCWAGLDLSSTTDLTALVLYFPYDGGAVLPFFWVPGDRLDEREERDKVPYRTWHRLGLIEAPAGRAIDQNAIVRRLAEIVAIFDLRGLAYDRWRIEALLKLLADEGIELPTEPFGQGYADMGPAFSALETAMLNRALRHGGHPVLTWCASNTRITTDPSGARKVAKDRCREKVDGIVALVMAMGLHAKQAPEAPGPFHPDDLAAMLSSQVSPWLGRAA